MNVEKLNLIELAPNELSQIKGGTVGIVAGGIFFFGLMTWALTAKISPSAKKI